MLKHWKFFVALVGVIILISFSIGQYRKNQFLSNYNNRIFHESKIYLDTTLDDEKKYIYDDEAHEVFISDYNFNNFIKTEAYEVNEQFCLNFLFDSNATRNDIESAKTVYSQMFFGDIVYGYMPYVDVVRNKDRYDDIILRIFVDGKLVIYKDYDFETLNEVYYESLDYQIKSRRIDNEHVDAFVKSTLSNLGSESVIEAQKPFKPFIYHFKIITSNKLEKKDIEKIKIAVENKLATQLEQDSKEVLGMNANALGIVLKFETIEEEYLEMMYFNGEKKKWIEDDWMSLDLFVENDFQ